MSTDNPTPSESFPTSGPRCTTAMHSWPARFLRSGDRFRWRGAIVTAAGKPIRRRGVVTVPLVLIDGSRGSVDIPVTVSVSLHHDVLDRPSDCPRADTADVSAELCSLAAQVDESGEAVDVAEHAARQTGVTGEDSARAERCARWNADDRAIAQAADDSEGWELE